ncbi:MAG: DMT family transporter [Lachnospiraceae bacterium]|nr:DMT family transporter [Lachnospiraceae bacterium]
MKMNDQSTILTKPLIVAILATICCLLWGSAFPAIKLGYRWFDIPAEATSTQIVFAGCRFALAGILTMIMGSILSGKVLVPKRTSFKKIAILSVFQTSLQYFCFYVGLAHTTGVKSSILNGISVFVAIIIAAVVFKQEKLTVVKLLGSALGFIGIILVNFNGADFDFSFHLWGEGMIVLSTVCYGFSSALIRLYGKDENPVILSGYQFALGRVVMACVGYMAGGRLETWSVKGFAILIYLAFVSAVAYTLWSLLLRYNDVSRVAVFGCLNPVFGAILSALILKEAGQSFGIKEVVALILISGGIFIVQKRKSAKS